MTPSRGFSDEELAEYKKLLDMDGISNPRLVALLSRLEAAENVCANMTNGSLIRYDRLRAAYEAWRKACGYNAGPNFRGKR